MFFSEKKNQKTLVLLAAVLLGGADAQSARALFDRGIALDNGKAARPDPAAAFTWYKRAAVAGSAAGAFNVGVMYDAGRGTAADEGQAAFWYAVAASEGEGRGAYNLGELYESGEGVPRSRALAGAWFRRAAALGIPAASARARTLSDDLHAQMAAASPPPAVTATALAIVPPDGSPPGVSLVWTVPASAAAPHFLVEIVGIDGSRAQDVFTAGTALSALHVDLPAGKYAGRIFTIDTAAGRYTQGPWTYFSLAEGQP